MKAGRILGTGRHFTFRIVLNVLLLVFTIQSNAQETHQPFMCSYYGEEVDPGIRTSDADEGAIKVIEQILSVVGLRPNFEILAANVPNAAAVIVDNKRYILYNPDFISTINSASGNDWAGISIIAHEIGHHLNGHTLQNEGSRPEIELEADEFSGFVLSKLGATLSDAQAAMNIAASQKASHTHPAKRDRLIAIAAGWRNAEVQNNRTVQTSETRKEIVRPVIVDNPEKTQNVLAEEYIAFDVNFNADSTGLYYITVKGNLVSVEDDSIYIIGRLAESNKRGYKLMLSDKNYNYLYIASQGAIVNGAGRKVGMIMKH